MSSQSSGALVGVFGGSDGEDTHHVVDALASLGVFQGVDRLFGTESVSQLAAYDAILMYNNYAIGNAAFGDVLADYVDAGGGLVAATFVYQTVWFAESFGRLQTGGYLPYDEYLDSYGSATLGAFDPNHPIMQGPLPVQSLTGHYRDRVTLSSDATLVASWSDGAPLVAVDGSGVVGVFLFPNVHFGQVEGDAMNLFGNALLYAAGEQAVVPEPGTWAIGVVGLAALGWVRRRRRSSR